MYHVYHFTRSHKAISYQKTHCYQTGRLNDPPSRKQVTSVSLCTNFSSNQQIPSGKGHSDVFVL